MSGHAKKAKLSGNDSNGNTPAPVDEEVINTNTDQKNIVGEEVINTNTDETDSDVMKLNPTIGEITNMGDFDDDDEDDYDHAENNMGLYEIGQRFDSEYYE